MEVLILGLVSAFNILVILSKYRRNKYVNATVDLLLMIAIGAIFNGSTQALCIGMIASCIISLYLAVNPLTDLRIGRR